MERLYVLTLVILAALVFWDTVQINRERNGGENLTPTTAVSMGNYSARPAIASDHSIAFKQFTTTLQN